MSEYPQEEKSRICEHICGEIAGGRSLRDIIENDSDLCSRRVFSMWLDKDKGGALTKSYIRSREMAAELFAEGIIAIADSATPETHNVARLQVDARKWIASRLLPKRYGDHQQIDANVNGEISVRIIKFSDSIEATDITPEDQLLSNDH